METNKIEFEAFRILNRKTNEAQGVYWRANYDKYDFLSAREARLSNSHGVYKDKDKYKIAKYKVTYELIEDDCE